MDELEVMRQQLASMKSQLDKQEIINKDLMRKVMRNKASWLNLLVKSELIALPLLYLLFAGICYISGISQWYSFSFLILAGVDAILDRRTICIPNELFGSSSIIELKKFLVRQKKERFVHICIGAILGFVWFILFTYAMATSDATVYPDDSLWNAVMKGGLAGAFVGVILAVIVIVMLYKKMQLTNDQIIADIDELEKEE